MRVLFFGATAEVSATRSMILQMPAGSTSAEARDKVVELYPLLASHKLLYSINQVYANGSERLKKDDELAIFTAVSGG